MTDRVKQYEETAELLRQAESTKAAQAKLNLRESFNANREEAGLASRLSREYNMPPSLFGDSLKEKENDYYAKESAKLFEKRDDVRNLFANPENARLAGDEVGLWARVSDTGRSAVGGFVGAVGSAYRGAGEVLDYAFTETTLGAQDFYAGLGFEFAKDKQKGEQAYQKLLEELRQGGVDTSNLPRSISTRGTIFDLAATGSKEAGGAIVDLAEFIDPPEERQNLVTEIAGGLGQLPVYAVSPGSMFTSGIDAGTQAAKRNNLYGTEQGDIATLGYGLVTKAMEKIGVDELLKANPALKSKLGKAFFDTAVKRGAVKKTMEVGGDAAYGALVEGTQEAAEQFFTNLIDQLVLGEEKSTFEGLKDSAVVGGGVGGVARAIIGSVVRGRATNSIQEQAIATSEKAGEFENTINELKDSKLKKRDPVKFREFLEALNATGKQLKLSVQGINELFQSGIDPKALFPNVSDIETSLAEAQAAGTDITLPLHDVMEVLSSDIGETEYRAVLDNLKIDESDFTIKEANDLQSLEAASQMADEIVSAYEQERAMLEEESLYLSEGEQVEQNVLSQLREVNAARTKGKFTESALKGYAASLRALYETLPQRYGEAALRVVEENFGKLQIQGADSRRTKIEEIDLILDRLRKRGASQKRAGKPLISYIRKKGGVHPESIFASELKNMDITQATYPGLFSRKSTLEDLDSLVRSEVAEDLDIDSSLLPENDTGDGYIDRNALLELIRDEHFGKDIRHQEAAYKNPEAEFEQDLIQTLDELGINLEATSNQEIKDALEEAFGNKESAQEFSQKYGKDKRGSFKIEESQYFITLFEGADLSTFLHESGHFWLETLSEIAAQPDASPGFKQDYQALLDWLEAKEGEALTTEQHEKFARGVEAYFMGGKAPSTKLGRVFTLFSEWLTRIYKSIKNLDVNVTPEVRAVFDRMLATDEEIETKSENKLFLPNHDTLEFLNKKQKQEYMEAFKKDKAQAKRYLYKKAIAQHRRKQTEFWNEELKALEKQALEDTKKSALYSLEKTLRTGKDYAGVQPFESPPKISRQAVRALYGNTEIIKYFPKGLTTNKEDGVDPKVLADFYGFSSAESMLEALANMKPLKQFAKEKAEQTMIDRYGDMLVDGSIEQEAIDALMSVMTAAPQIELEALQERAKKLVPNQKDFDIAAERIIASKVINKINAYSYFRAALKHAKEYGKFLAEGDYEQAFESKKKEILNRKLNKYAREARQEVEKAVKNFKKLSKPQKKGKLKIENEYHEKIVQILNAYNLATPSAANRVEGLNLQAIDAWIKEKQDDDIALIMPPELMQAGAKKYNQLSFEQFEALKDLISNIETTGRSILEYTVGEEKRRIEDLESELVQTAEKYNKPIEKAVSQRRADRKITNKVGKLASAIDAVNTKASVFLRQLDGGKERGIWYNTIYKPIADAEVRKNMRNRKELKRFQEIIKKHYGDEKIKFSGKDALKRQTLLHTFLDQEYTVKGQVLRKEEILSIALHQGSLDNRQKLLDGWGQTKGWDVGFINEALSLLEDRDWDFVVDIRDYLESFREESFAVEERRMGYKPQAVEPAVLNITKDGQTRQIKGGYMRIMYDPELDVRAKNDEQRDYFKEMSMGVATRASTRRGSMMERVQNVQRPIRLDFDVISEHIAETITMIEMSEAVDNVAKVLRREDIQKATKEFLGDAGKEQLDLWLSDVAAGGALAGGMINKTLRRIRANYTLGRLGWKPATALLQVSGLTQAAGDLGVRSMLSGLQTYSKNPARAISEIKQKSDVFKEREFSLSRDIADAIRDIANNPVQSKVDDFATAGLWMIQKAQQQVDAISWLAAYHKSLKQNPSEDIAVEVADEALIRTQGSGNISDLAGIERGSLTTRTQRQEYVKASMMFFSYFNAKYNLAKTKTIQYRNKEIGLLDLASSYFLVFVVEGFISSLLLGQLDLDEDDDGEITTLELATVAAKTGLDQVAASIPFINQVSSGVQGFGGGSAADRQLTTLGGFVGKTLRSIGSEKESNQYAYARNALDTLNLFLPIPAGQLNQILRGIEKDGSALDYMVYRK